MADDDEQPVDDGVTYGATIRPGSPDEQSVRGLSEDELDEWLVANGSTGDAFTCLALAVSGDLLVRGEGHVEDGEAFYRLSG